MAAVHNGHINILRKLIKLGYTDKKAITSITIILHVVNGFLHIWRNGFHLSEKFSENALHGRSHIVYILTDCHFQIIAVDICGRNQGERHFKIFPDMLIIAAHASHKIHKRHHRKENGKNGCKEDVIHKNGYHTTHYHKNE